MTTKNKKLLPKNMIISYENWFAEIVQLGWICGLGHPIEILANWLHSATMPYDELRIYIPYTQQFMIEVTTHEQMKREAVSLEEAVKFFNSYYKDKRMNFGFYAEMPN